MQEKPDTFNKANIIKSFNAAADSYDEVAELQCQVGDQIIERLQYIKKDFGDIIDVGSGTGYCHNQLKQLYPRGLFYSLDIAHAMLLQARKKLSFYRRWIKTQSLYVCGDIETMPIADNSVDLIVSNLALQWVNEPQKAYQELFRILRPGGLLMFSTLGPDTLKELRHSWQAVDDKARVHPFIDMHHVGDMLLGAMFSDPVMDVEYYTLHYKSVRDLMRELKKLGAHNAHTQRAAGLTGKNTLAKMLKAYEKYRLDDLLPASYEVVFGHAWKREAHSGQVNVSLT